jgi:lysylphosphatidylglycerol synthetase-like protein (DUF2156 family)
MGYAAIALAILGFAVGVISRLAALLPIVGLVLVVSVILSLGRGFTFLETTLTIVIAQTILQGAYFLGLVARWIFLHTDADRPPTSRPPPDTRGDRHDFKVFDIPSRTRRWPRRFAPGIARDRLPCRQR